MFIKEINEVKKILENMRSNNLISEWTLPNESSITRMSTAVFFLTPATSDAESVIWKELSRYNYFSFRLNNEKLISPLTYRVTFNKEEKIKNLQIP